MLTKYDLWLAKYPEDRGHYEECCVMVNSHWESPRCNCKELADEWKGERENAELG